MLKITQTSVPWKPAFLRGTHINRTYCKKEKEKLKFRTLIETNKQG